MKTTSYGQAEWDFLTALVRLVKATSVVEIGAQQGASAIALGRGLPPVAAFVGGELHTLDLFEPNYPLPPHGPTHADQAATALNLSQADLKCAWCVYKLDGVRAADTFNDPDVLHVDICNHYDNLKPILKAWEFKVKKLIILEGGRLNHWQEEFGFLSFLPMLDEPWMNQWNYNVYPTLPGHDITVLTRTP